MQISTTQAQAFLNDMQTLLCDPAFVRVARYQQNRNWTLCLGLKEVHYCRILQWLLSPQEGHGLGDFFLKRLLMAANREATALQQASWPLIDQIATINLDAAVVEAEVMLDPANGLHQRLDLLVIDPVQRLVVVIERKDGASLGVAQLVPYERWIRATYPDYQPLFILSDHDEQDHGLNAGNAWVQIGDDWLVASLNEALIPGRLPSNMQQRLEDIVAHFDYEHPDRDAFFAGIDAELAQVAATHREPLQRLGDNPVNKLTSKDIITGHLCRAPSSPMAPEHRALLLRLQYRSILGILAEYNGFLVLQERLQALYNDDTLCFEPGLHHVTISTERMKARWESDEAIHYWPVRLRLTLPISTDPALEDDEEPPEAPMATVELYLDMKALGSERKAELVNAALERGLTPSRRYASRIDTLPSGKAILDKPYSLLPWLNMFRELVAIVED